ncbi:hypothetical protein MVES_002728 [Malassezia vespertilionis]|uniref:Prefoldin subunit 6 n=1 Tax=Malassezia vespertilionis TaxID=2020962 RepID=A0A2N1J9B6_9BASI|nr:hypothetical protein MVES_002728 [Malassezia vespertilionis]
MPDEERLRAAATKFQEIQTQFESVVDSQQQLLSQLSENQQVQKEFGSLAPDARVYKRTGPVLLPQDFKEARVNVEKRIEFIQNEIKRVEDKIQSLGTQRDTIRNDILAIQQGS